MYVYPIAAIFVEIPAINEQWAFTPYVKLTVRPSASYVKWDIWLSYANWDLLGIRVYS